MFQYVENLLHSNECTESNCLTFDSVDLLSAQFQELNGLVLDHIRI